MQTLWFPHGNQPWARILVQATIYRRLLIGRDGQSEAYDISWLVREYGPWRTKSADIELKHY